MWIWVVGVVGVVLFFYFRGQTISEYDAEILEEQVPGFGPKIDLLTAARGYLSFPISWCLLLGTIAAWAWRVQLGNFSQWDIITVALILGAWPFQEWAIHAWLLHLKPMKIAGREFEPLVVRTHRIHHQNPWVPKLGLTTPHMIVAYLVGLPLMSSLFMSIELAATTTAVTIAMILNYEWVHYLIHTSYQPKTELYRRMWRNHRLHHFKNEKLWFGVTMTAGDTILGTSPSREDAPHSTTCLTLGVEQERSQWTDCNEAAKP